MKGYRTIQGCRVEGKQLSLVVNVPLKHLMHPDNEEIAKAALDWVIEQQVALEHREREISAYTAAYDDRTGIRVLGKGPGV
jgi:hypothetical protein